MTIMSDNWIKKMALEHDMIDPFMMAKKKMEQYLMGYLLMAMMREFQTNLKFLPM